MSGEVTSAVLGLDPGWTSTSATGVAIVRERAGRWEAVAVASSYADYFSVCAGETYAGTRCDAARLIATASRLAGRHIDVVAADVPLSLVEITGRRAADDAISRAFGAMGASTHSPSAERPGPLGVAISEGLAAAGYPLATAGTEPGTRGRLIEVYPHPALIALLSESKRLPYKVGKRARYWPESSAADRLLQLKASWERILAALRAEIAGIALQTPVRDLKRFEDALDALIAAWVGVAYLRGAARAYGDADAAIWVPG